jgi:Na+-translocating ferredoxin:NAD+ oxidoreductase RnfE subunit
VNCYVLGRFRQAAERDTSDSGVLNGVLFGLGDSTALNICLQTSVHKIQTPGNHSKEGIYKIACR